MQRKFDIGDIVYLKKEGLNHQYEVVYVYPIETGEKHFKLKRLISDTFLKVFPELEETLFRSTENYLHIPFVCEKDVMFEKYKIPKKYKYNSPDYEEDYCIPLR